jgi:dTDP-L-rhamnose 4-epimerase
MSSRILITGGAGFIGSHLADELLAAGYSVSVLDSLDPQVHETGERPTYLDDEVELIEGDVRDADLTGRLVRRADAVVHLAAAVGVGQSMYQLHRYVDVNALGTATLLEAVARHPVEKLVVASSMSVYGEGAYHDASGQLVHPPRRTSAQMSRREWDLKGHDGEPLVPVPTPEHVTPLPTSPYALTKYDQELLTLMTGSAYDVPAVAMRLFNVYGPRQALSNPYTGVMAIFACRLLNGNPPLIYEDGEQLRDFVNVHDVARAFRLALENRDLADTVFNIGSGSAVSIREIATGIGEVLGHDDVEPQIVGKYRVGDVRHCFADISAAAALGYRPQVTLENGLLELAGWLEGQAAVDRVGQASDELNRRGLAV